MNHDAKLAHAAVWATDGHPTDEVVTALADGQDAIVPDDAIDHVHSCTPCTERLGAAALLSLSIGDALAGMPERAVAVESAPTSAAPSRAFAAIPLRAVAAALAIAGIGALPALSEFPAQVSEFSAGLPRTVAFFAKSGLLMMRGVAGGPLQVGLICASLLVLTMAAVGLTRSLPAPAVGRVAK